MILRENLWNNNNNSTRNAVNKERNETVGVQEQNVWKIIFICDFIGVSDVCDTWMMYGP